MYHLAHQLGRLPHEITGAPRHQITMMLAHLDLQAEARREAEIERLKYQANPAGYLAEIETGQALERDLEARDEWATATMTDLHEGAARW